jgi:hypothetical protein
MSKSTLQRALESSHSKFLVNGIRKGTDSITQWVEENLIKENPSTDAKSKIAFYEAEKSLIIEYIMENDFSGLKTLIDAIDNEKFKNNQKLKVNECRVLANAIIEAQEYRCVKESTSMHSNLHKLLDTKYKELTDEGYKSKISDKVMEALSIVQYTATDSSEVSVTGEISG